MIRRTLTAAVVALGIAAVTPLAASAARPPAPTLPFPSAKAGAAVAGSCIMSAPARVAISRPYLALPIKAAGECTVPGSGGAWQLVHPSQGPGEVAIFDGKATDTWDLFSDDFIGQQTWKPLGSSDAEGNPYTQNSPVSTVKLAAGAWISSSRVGDIVYLKGTSLLYSVSTNSFFKRSAAGEFQFRERGTTQWKRLKTVYTNSKGEATMGYRYSTTRDYRFALYSTPISWDLGSAVTTR